MLHECAEHNGLTPEQEQMLLELSRRTVSRSDITEAIDPLVKVRRVDKILTTEYHMGYIPSANRITLEMISAVLGSSSTNGRKNRPLCRE